MSENNINVTVRKRRKLKPDNEPETPKLSHDPEAESSLNCNKTTPPKNDNVNML